MFSGFHNDIYTMEKEKLKPFFSVINYSYVLGIHFCTILLILHHCYFHKKPFSMQWNRRRDEIAKGRGKSTGAFGFSNLFNEVLNVLKCA